MWPWNRNKVEVQKRLNDLEGKIKSIENKKIYIPSNIEHTEMVGSLFGPWMRYYGKNKPVTAEDALCLIIDYLHLKINEEPAKTKVQGILDEKKPKAKANANK